MPAKKVIKEESAKTEEKTVKKTTAKKPAAKKAAPKKSTAKKVDDQKISQYNQFSLDTCIDMARAMGINMGYDQYAALLLDNSDLKKVAEKIVKDNETEVSKHTFDEDGYDADLVEVLVKKIADTMDIKASDFADLAKDIKAHVAYEIKDDAVENNDEYKAQFEIIKRVLMIAQRKDIHTMAEMKSLLKVDPTEFVNKFMDVALVVLKNWQYDDVKYYENFIYAVLSQFTDLYESNENRAQMDVADLYIVHGDYRLGDSNYSYILRENQLKDYIYYRFAKVYADVDREKSRAIAQEALGVIDDRYTYYSDIVKLLED